MLLAGAAGACRLVAAAARAALALPALGLLQHGRVGLVALDGGEGDVLADELLDLLERLHGLARDEGDGEALLAGTARAADAVHVVLGHVGQVEVDDVVHLGHVDAACQHVGGHQDVGLAAAEVLQGATAAALGLVGVDGLGVETGGLKRFGALLGAVLGAGEHDDALVALVVEHRFQKLLLLAVGDGHDVLGHGGSGLAVAGDLDDGRVLQQVAQVLLDGAVDGRGKQQRLAFGRRVLHDLGDVGQEAHVKHAVGLVEHEHLGLGQVDHAAVHQVVQAAGSGDEHVGAAAQLADLRTVGRAAVHGGHEVAGFAGDLHARAADLLSQLARGADDAHARGAAAALHALERGQRGQQERCGLAGAGGGGGDDVAAFQDVGDGLLLNGRGGVVAHALDGGEGCLGQAQFCKCGHVRSVSLRGSSAQQTKASGNGRHRFQSSACNLCTNSSHPPQAACLRLTRAAFYMPCAVRVRAREKKI